jgi:hypothetical protein
MSSSEKYKRQSEELRLFLGELGDHLGQTSGFVQRQSLLSGSKLVQILTLGSLENGTTSLRGFCRVGARLGIKISESGLHQRLEAGAVALLRQVSQAYLWQKSQGAVKAVFAPFPQVYLVDSTEIRLPDHLKTLFRGRRCASSLKVQLAYEYKQGHMEALEIEAGCQPDQNNDLGVDVAARGDLVLFDLGYFDQERFARLEDKGVFFVSRLHSQVGLYNSPTSQQAVKLLEVVRSRGACGELSYYLGHRQRLAVRVLYYHLPPEVIAERRRKAHAAARKNGTTCSQHSLDSLEWLFFITNAPALFLTVDQVAAVYRVRWQIELVFKVWKSEMHMSSLGTWRIERVLAQFYARLLALLIFHRLIEDYPQHPTAELSLIQAYQLLRTQCRPPDPHCQTVFLGSFKLPTRFLSRSSAFCPENKTPKKSIDSCSFSRCGGLA